MTQALNYIPKAIGDLQQLAAGCDRNAPLSAAGVRYLIGKLLRAEVFVLPLMGELLDRSKLRPQLPGIAYRPPFPVVAAEYPSSGPVQDVLVRNTAVSKRIALAWQGDGADLPGGTRACMEPISEGVTIASIGFFDEQQRWLPISVAGLVLMCAAVTFGGCPATA